MRAARTVLLPVLLVAPWSLAAAWASSIAAQSPTPWWPMPQRTLEHLIFAWRPASVTRWPRDIG